MTVKFSLDLKAEINPCTNKVCKSCGLYLHQLPASEKAGTSHIFWVGLSAVLFEDGIEPKPLSSLTKTGILIDKIEEPLRPKIRFYKTNLVKCVPLNTEAGKIRYPHEHEMEKCFPNLEYEIDALSPTLVFLLGKQTASFFMKKYGISDISLSEDYKYKSYQINGIYFIPVHHPSYILVYKRTQVNSYVKSIQKICSKLVKKKKNSVTV